ncbi:hypothetical protein SAMN02745165_00190 [Malonomonas rubra DSM 5091]|uniref:Antitermination protein NusB n=1 Tax=Malonomonas rubra DSM 5091 TaxID=1122189 RepID=A0A1M6BIN5_MALRU|nr:hypothetical protein [Malonomonas rubra]SHI48353.1 hypothetical protein SAMN02745165_00190 [Malonomonas rubra DSM 5091]
MALEYLLLWAMFGFAAGSLAKGKNRRQNIWFCIGLLLGPFAVLIIAILKPAQGPEQKYK